QLCKSVLTEGNGASGFMLTDENAHPGTEMDPGSPGGVRGKTPTGCKSFVFNALRMIAAGRRRAGPGPGTAIALQTTQAGSNSMGIHGVPQKTEGWFPC